MKTNVIKGIVIGAFAAVLIASIAVCGRIYETHNNKVALVVTEESSNAGVYSAVEDYFDLRGRV